MCKYVLTFIGSCIISTSVLVAQPANLKLEKWTTTSNNTDPDGWQTTDQRTPSVVPETVTKETGNPGEGSASAKMAVISSFGQNIPGIIGQQAVYSSRPFSASFMAKANISRNDTGMVNFELLNYDQVNDTAIVVGTAHVKFSSSAQNTWQHYKVQYNYVNNMTPDSIRIIAASSYLPNPVNGSQLWVDSFVISSGCKINAGKDTTINVCKTDSSVNLFDNLGGNPDSTGQWNDDKNTGALTDSLFDATSVSPGSYTFTYTVAKSGCITDSATITVVVNDFPNAGQDSTILVCMNNSAVDLSEGLGGSPDSPGTWLDDDGTGAISGDTFDATVPSAGQSYHFTYVVKNQGCGSDSATVTVDVRKLPNAGQDSNAAVCHTQTSVDLFNFLSGTQNNSGTWLDLDNTQALSNSIFDPSAVNSGNIYTFGYTVSGSVCPADSAFIDLKVNAPKPAGKDSSSTVCGDAGSIRLIDHLEGSPATRGTWTDLDNTGALSNGRFDVTAVSKGQYDFEYTVKTNGCSPETAIATINVIDPPNAGEDSVVVICISASFVDLFASLAGDPDTTGSWSDVDQTGTLNNDTFRVSGVSMGDYDFTYTVDKQYCRSRSTTVTVSVVAQAKAGQDSAFPVCENDAMVDLVTHIGGSFHTGGTWRDVDQTGAVNDGIFNATRVKSGNTYNFIYKVTLKGCAADSSFLKVSVSSLPDPGRDTTIEVCNTSNNVDLTEHLGGNPMQDGIWTDRNNTGALSDGIFDATQVETGKSYHFIYTVSTPECRDTFAILTVGVKNCQGIEEDQQRVAKVYPNPAEEHIYFEFNSPKARSISIHTITGRRLVNHEVNIPITRLPINSLKAGLYLYQIKGQNGELLSTGRFSVFRHR